MQTVLTVLLVLIVIALITVVMLQKSEGGGLVGGGSSGGGMSGFMSGRSTANLLTRTTGILFGCLMVICLVLAILAGRQRNVSGSILDRIPVTGAPSPAIPAPAGTAVPPAPAKPASPQPPAKPGVPLAQ